MIPTPDAQGAWLAPAKLNLTLRIVGRRADGYHHLQTVFQFLDYADRIWLTVRNDGVIDRLRGPDDVPVETDLTVRAARLLQKTTQCPLGVTIDVEKHLPMGGGLGGGSSDAATVLHALNHLWHLQLTTEDLARLGLSLGADVPVFIGGRAAWAEGVGEQLQPLELPCPWYVILTPACQVSTAAVFNDPELPRNSPLITVDDFIAGDQRNDCLAVVLRHYPAVADAFQWLAERAEARLTGTGSCLFAAFSDRAQAEAIAHQAAPTWPAIVARGCNYSPLVGAGGD
jgi:4-diphosphocytidyl-2-C-methyl-D-erythritol kinase